MRIGGIMITNIEGIKVTKLSKKVDFSTSYDSEDRPSDFVFGRWFIGKMSNGKATVISTKKFINSLKDDPRPRKTEDKNEDDQEPEKCITVYCREGTYSYANYPKINFYPRKIEPHERQAKIVADITETYNSNYQGEKKYSCVAILHGRPGSGKSAIATFLARELLKKHSKVSYIDFFNPTLPGHNFDVIYTNVTPEEDEPLIVVLEEFDVLIEKIMEGKCMQHLDVPTMISNKIDWNLFFDKIEKGVYRYTYFVLTTNKPMDWFDVKDKSLLREGRVDLKFEVN